MRKEATEMTNFALRYFIQRGTHVFARALKVRKTYILIH